MKKKAVKATLFVHLVFFIFFFSSTLGVRPVFAVSSAGGHCTSDNECDKSQGLTCDLGSDTCIMTGDLCALRQFPCANGYTCDPSTGSCIPVAPTPPVIQPNPTLTPPPSGISPNPGSSLPTGGLICPTGLVNANGVCLPPNPYGGQPGVAGSETLVDLISRVLRALLFLAGIIAVIFVIVGGYWYLTSAGNEEQSEKGRKALISAIIGLVVVVLAFVIVSVITSSLTGGVADTGGQTPSSIGQTLR